MIKFENSGDNTGIRNVAVKLDFADGTGAQFVTEKQIGETAADSDLEIYVGDMTTPKMTILDSGNVGIGTTAPGKPLEVATGQPGLKTVFYVHDTSGTAKPNLSIKLNDAEGVEIKTGFASGIPGNLKIIPTGGNSSLILGSNGTERVRIENTGDVGIGTTNPSYKLHVAGTAFCTSGSWSGSDVRWKESVERLASPLEKIERLRGVSFYWKNAESTGLNFPAGRQIGVIAQEIEQVFPELVTTGGDGYKAVAYDKLGAVLIEAVKELKNENDALKARNAEIMSRLEALEARKR